MDASELEVFYGKIKEVCQTYYTEEAKTDLFELASQCLNIDGLPMHCSPHHFLIPAVLLTICHKIQGDPYEYLNEDLEEANKRAHNVPGGFCGFYGSCGAAIGTGIFMSIYTQTNPCSEETWAWCNRCTADALTDIASVNGPRCCKRNTWLSLLRACDEIEKFLNIKICKPEHLNCTFHDRNKECKKGECPFFPVNIK